MAELFASGRVIDLVLALVALEVFALPWLLRRLSAGVTLGMLLPNIAAGVALMLALRASLTDARWQWIALALFIALLAHLYDLYRRLQTPAG